MIFLKVPYSEKDEAKALGARWNNARKCWYVPDGQASTAFERWLGPQPDGPAPTAKPAKDKPAQVDAFGAKPVEGKHFVALEHDCDPFTVCPVCQPILQTSGWTAAHGVLASMIEQLKSGR